MAELLGGGQTVPPEEVVLARAFQLEALLKVPERKGVVRKVGVFAEIKRLHEKGPKALQSEEPRRHGWCRSTDRCPQ